MRFTDIWNMVEKIPRGRVATYGQIALMLGDGRGARTVGFAMSSCPRDRNCPCHRVVDRFGGTKIAFDTWAPGTQRAMLEAEGVGFTEEGNVDLARYQWDGKEGLS